MGIECGVLATIEQWYPTRKFNGTMVPHKGNSIVWPHLVTKEKTISTPQVPCVRCVCECVSGVNRGLITKGNYGYLGWHVTCQQMSSVEKRVQI